MSERFSACLSIPRINDIGSAQGREATEKEEKHLRSCRHCMRVMRRLSIKGFRIFPKGGQRCST